MMTTELTAPALSLTIGALLRQWREHRRLSQLDLALDAEISTRHLSFLETGKAQPSREMILRLAEQLNVPLRERNRLLLAGGYAPIYTESALDSPELATMRYAVQQVLRGHEPHPALVVSGDWTLLEANAGAALFLEGVARELLLPPVNVLRVSLHPDGLAPRILNLGEWRAHLLGRLQRQVTMTTSTALEALYEELRSYPCTQPEPEIELPGLGTIFIPLRLRHAGRDLSFFSTVTTFGTPLDITLSELVIEAFFPADPETVAFLRA